MNEKFIINIGRQLGSGGKDIGEKLANIFKIDFYDKEILKIASRESGLSTEVFEKADEKASQGLMGGVFGMRFPFLSEGSLPYANNYLTSDALFKIQSDVIRRLAEEKSCLFVGRCADYILRDNPRCVNIFICADLDSRITRVAQNLQVSQEKAEEIIHKVDKQRASYYNYYSYKTWGAAATYHLCIDSSILGIDDTVEFIKEFAIKKLKIEL